MNNQVFIPIRHFQNTIEWFIPTEDRTKIVVSFRYGLMENVTFNPKALVMRDIFCGYGRISESEALGLKLQYRNNKPYEMPSEVVCAKAISYDPLQKNFHEREETARAILSADYLLLDAGRAIAGWKIAH